MKNKPSYEISESDIALIAAYLRRELDAVQQADFEQRSIADPHWHQKTEEVKALIAGVEEANMTSLITTWHDNMLAKNNDLHPKQRIVPLYRRWWAVACLALIVLSTAWFFWPKTNTYEALYSTYFEPDMGLPVAMSTIDTAQYTLYDGMISYKEGNYNDALSKWETLAQTDTLQYFSGLAYMGLGDMTEAKSRLLPVSTDLPSTFHQDAIWYLALCHLHEGNKVETERLLNRITGHRSAQELLRKLE